MQTQRPQDLVYTPAEVTTIGTAYLQERMQNKALGIPLGLKSIDRDLVPLQAGDICAILGRPGHGKTSFMVRWARYRSEWLLKNKHENRIVVYVTLEQSIEALYAFDVAAGSGVSVTSMARGEITEDQLQATIRKGVQNIERPLWFIGHSQERRKKRPILSLETIAESLRSIETWAGDNNYAIDCVFLDYLQRFPWDRSAESKVVGMDWVINDIKDNSFAFACPFIVGVQAKREVDDRAVPVPMMEDGQWCSAIEQVFDTVISTVRPRKYRSEGEEFGKKNPIVVEGENQMLVSLLKQKMGPANIPYWVMFDPIYNRLDEAELRHVNLNDVAGAR